MRFERITRVVIHFLIVAALPSSVHAAAARQTDSVQSVRSLLATPENQIDFAKAKLAIDKLIDPRIDIESARRQIDEMVRRIQKMAGPNASTIQRLAAVRRFIYVSGDWNGHEPFQYDLGDPLGKKMANKLLPAYLATRRGNCVSMPILFIILADRMGVHVTLSTVPFHLFVKFVDDATGKVYNLETTSGGYPARDIYYRQKVPMTDEAIKNGLYMKTLSRKETVTVIAELLLEHFAATKQDTKVIGIANLILNYYPNNVEAILTRAAAYGNRIDTEFKQKYLRPIDIPRNLIPTYWLYVHENELGFQKAEALGWREEQPNTAIPIKAN